MTLDGFYHSVSLRDSNLTGLDIPDTRVERLGVARANTSGLSNGVRHGVS